MGIGDRDRSVAQWLMGGWTEGKMADGWIMDSVASESRANTGGGGVVG